MSCRRAKYADPRWQTDKSLVRFAQKGLFQVDVCVHHAMLSSAIASYQKAASQDTAGAEFCISSEIPDVFVGCTVHVLYCANCCAVLC